jgi:hypothetical protein
VWGLVGRPRCRERQQPGAFSSRLLLAPSLIATAFAQALVAVEQGASTSEGEMHLTSGTHDSLVSLRGLTS